MTIPFYQVHSNSNAPNYVDYERPKYWWARLDPGPTFGSCFCSFGTTCPDRHSGLSPWVPVQVNICDRSYQIPTGGQCFGWCQNAQGNQCSISLDYQGSIGPVSFANMYRPCKPVTDACGCTVTGIHNIHSYSTGSADQIVNFSTMMCCVMQGLANSGSFTSGVTRTPNIGISLPTCQSCSNYWNNHICNYSPIVYSPTAGASFGSKTISTQCHCSNGYSDICLQTFMGLFSLENAIDCDCCNWGSCSSRSAVVCHGIFSAKLCVSPCVSSVGGCSHRFYHWIQNDENNPDYFYHVQSFSSLNRTHVVCNCHCWAIFGNGNSSVQSCCGGIFDHTVARVKINGSATGSTFGKHCVTEAIIFPVSCLQSDSFITRGTFKKLCNIADDQFLLTTNGTSLDWQHSVTCRCCKASTKILSFDIATGCTCVIRMNKGCSCTDNFCNTYTDAVYTSRGTFVVLTALGACANCLNSNYGFSQIYVSEFNCDFTCNLGTITIRPYNKRSYDCDCNALSCTVDVANLAYDKYDDSVIVSFGKSSAFSCTLGSCGFCGRSSGAINVMKIPSCVGQFCQYLCEQCRYSGGRCCAFYCCCCKQYSCTFNPAGSRLGVTSWVRNAPTCCLCAQRTVFTSPTICSTGSFLNNCRDYCQFLQRLCWTACGFCCCCTCLCIGTCMATNPSLFCRFRFVEGQQCGDGVCCGCAGSYCKDYTSQHSPAIAYTAFCVECN